MGAKIKVPSSVKTHKWQIAVWKDADDHIIGVKSGSAVGPTAPLKTAEVLFVLYYFQSEKIVFCISFQKVVGSIV